MLVQVLASKLAGVVRYSYDRCKLIAADHDFELLDGECNFINVSCSMHWQCSNGHVRRCKLHSLASNDFRCRLCDLGCSDISSLDKIINNKGGSLLSIRICSGEKLIVRCAEGHVFEAHWHNIVKQGLWCGKCSVTARLTIEDCQKSAAERGGKCLSTQYKNTRTHMLWECSDGHLWEATYGKIREGRWCPVCDKKKVLDENGFCINIDLDYCCKVAASYDFICLSTKYVNGNNQMCWKCPNDHLTNASFSYMLSNNFVCNKCKNSWPSLEEISEHAKSMGMVYLGIRYVPGDNHTWKCKCGNIFESPWHYVKKGFYCSNCSKNKKLTIEDCHRIAEENGFVFLGDECLGAQVKMPWICVCGRECMATTTSVKAGRRCVKCAYLKTTIEELKDFAIGKGGICLSDQYNATEKHTWQCSEGHIWDAMWSSVKTGGWCPDCAGYKSYTIKDCVALAEEMGGKCLEVDYINRKTIMRWECENGHLFESTFGRIINDNGWCPECMIRGRQGQLYKIVSQIFPEYKVEYNYKSFGWLMNNKTGQKLEYDIYVDEIKLAIEHDGEQHFCPVRFGGVSLEKATAAFEELKYRDRLKNKLSRQNGIRLVRFKYDEELSREAVEKKLKKI